MKVLYAAFRHDPRDPDLGSSVDYEFYSAILRAGMEVRVVGPFPGPFPKIERLFRHLYKACTGKAYLPWDLISTVRSSCALNRAVARWKPDVVFTIFPSPLLFYKGNAPCVLNTDTTSLGKQEAGANYGQFALKVLTTIEKHAAQLSKRVITFSAWCKQDLIQSYGIEADKITVFPMPSALPLNAVPDHIEVRIEKRLETPLKLLLVGRSFKRKGVDIALEVVQLLNDRGTATELTVCGTRGPRMPHVSYVGPYQKKNREELAQYMELYRGAHLLLHTARFEPAGIVPGEAAAFATPTVTSNALGGLATTVKDGVSGIVLPKNAMPIDYAYAIEALVADPERYYALCVSARQRYEDTLNWSVAGEQLTNILKEVVFPGELARA